MVWKGLFENRVGGWLSLRALPGNPGWLSMIYLEGLVCLTSPDPQAALFPDAVSGARKVAALRGDRLPQPRPEANCEHPKSPLQPDEFIRRSSERSKVAASDVIHPHLPKHC